MANQITDKKEDQTYDYSGYLGPVMQRQNNAGSNPSPSYPASSPYDDELAQLARKQDYETYMNKYVQLDAVRQAAENKLNATNEAMGYAGTGEGGSNFIDLYNHFLNSRSTLDQGYNSNELNITRDAYQRYTDEIANRDAGLIANIQQAPDWQTAQAYLQNYGYMDKSGNYTEKWNALGSDRQSAINNALIGRNAEFSSPVPQGATGMSIDELRKSRIGNSGNKTMDDKHGVKNETNTMENLVNTSTGEYNGTLFTLKNTDERKYGDSVAYVIYYNGKYYRVSADFANAYAGSKVTIQGSQAYDAYGNKI